MSLPIIEVYNRHSRDISADVVAAFVAANQASPKVFCLGAQLVHKQKDAYYPVSRGFLRFLLVRVADYVSSASGEALQTRFPDWLISDVRLSLLGNGVDAEPMVPIVTGVLVVSADVEEGESE